MDVVRAVFAAFAERDVEGVLAHAHPEVEFTAVTGGHAGRTEPYRGHDGLRQYMADVERVWEELELHADDYRVIPGSVIVMGHVTGRTADGPVRRSAVWTWRLEALRVVSVRVADVGPR